MKFEADQLILRHETTITCPKCATEVSLDQGFAKKALVQLLEASAGATAVMRDAEQTNVEKLAKEMANEQARAAQSEANKVKILFKEQPEANVRSLAEVRNLAEKSVAPRMEEMQKALNEQQEQLTTLRAREDALATREKDLDSRVNTAAALPHECRTRDNRRML